MAKLSLVKQFESNINAIAEVKSMTKVKRALNNCRNTEYSAEVVFAGHENNAFMLYWDTVLDRYFINRYEICRHDGFVSHRTEIFNTDYYRKGSRSEICEFIKSTWDKQNPKW